MKKRPPRQGMPKQEPSVRARNFKEVALGYTEEMAVAEANRCLQCKDVPCVAGCLVEIDIPAFIKKVSESDFEGAARILKQKNALPAICGRVCPQEDQCEKVCVLIKKGEPIAIGYLERFVADWEAGHLKGEETSAIQKVQDRHEATGSVAIVGSGPAGLTLAGDLAKLGYRVVIFEALHKPGGVLKYGIPEFRLPRAIVEREVAYVKSLGVEIKTDYVIGRILTIDDLFRDGFDAVYVATGAGLPKFMGIPGENLSGVYSSNEFLTRINLMEAYRFPEYKTPLKIGKKVAVVGGGNVAMDAARTALRLGADEVHLIYRRSRTEMPARIEEVENAGEEGIIFHYLTNPVRIIGGAKENARGRWVRAIECIRMELGEPDESGRRSPIPISGSEFIMPVDIVIMAIGTGANPLISSTTKDLPVDRWGYIVTEPETGRTSKEGVWAGGDIVTGSATVIAAMGAARRAARSIHEYISQKKAVLKKR
jgi:glutamate synthase (NADPH/NADH) small chain